MTVEPPPGSHDRDDATIEPRNARTADVNARKSHLRSLAIAGTLASVGTFTVLAATATDTPPTGGQVDVLENQTADQLGDGLTDDMVQTPSDPWGADSGQGSWESSHHHDSSGYFDPSQGQGSQIGPPQAGLGRSGMTPSMSGGS